MSKTRCQLVILLALASLTALGCRSPRASERLSVVGGLAGAGIGAAIGEDDGDAVPGAIIGGLAGAVTGHVVGDEIDYQAQQNRAVVEQRLGRQMSGAVTTHDVITMTQAGLGDQVIITHLQANGVARIPTAADLITMKQQGVSDAVLAAMQAPSPAPTVIRQAPQPVIVREHYVAPYCYGPSYRYHRHYHRPHHHHHHRRGGTSFGFSIHN